MPYIEHQYGRTFYQKRGSKRLAGLPIVCLHGGPGGHCQSMTELFALADERQVYIYDQIGGGRSSPTSKKEWQVPVFVNELKTLTEAWGIDQFHLFGASWGTTLALEYYLRGGRRQIKSITFQSPLFSTHDWQADANKLIKGLSAQDRKVIEYCHEIDATDSQVYKDAMRAYYDKHVCRRKKKRNKTISNTHGEAVYSHMWGASEFNATGTLKNYDRTHDLHKINCPTQLICGHFDEARPATARRYKQQIEGAAFHEIPNASHAILTEKPKALIKIIRRFLRQHDA